MEKVFLFKGVYITSVTIQGNKKDRIRVKLIMGIDNV